MMVSESNGEGVLGPDSGDSWPTEVDAVAGSPAPLSLGERVGLGAADQAEDICVIEERLSEDGLDERPVEEKHNCEQLSPPSQERASEGAGADPAMPETIFIPPLDGSQAELRTRVIKEVRKPGRSEYEAHSLLHVHSHTLQQGSTH